MDIDIAGKLFPNITTLIVQLLSTGVMLFVFKRYLWSPVQAYFEKRADFIENQIDEAKEMNEKAKTFVVESEKQARDSAREYRDIVERAKSDALKVRDDIIVEARKEAASKIEQAEKEIAAEKVQARADMKEEIVDIAMDVATKIMKKEMNTKENEKLVNEFVEEVIK
ncbi:F0F1 ATP synthase subunit B [Candidatus Stoquefichus sp. SB1]|uniref:F0F1 ATP synthase subunit B n=1 Tax=Candidatus Stoquefichus sp. SB1 TaxID=1658109 RepID=UPI00067EA8EF|nr:F0F1 ATP synthase subunit B [Candidatus Stoquefichus sp. SB1]